MSGTCGRTWRAPFAFYDPGTSCLRTSAGTFDLGLTESSPILPDWGTWAAGEFFELPTPALPTAGPESSSLLPTPAARDGDGRGAQSGAARRAAGHQVDLPEAVVDVVLLGTPRVTTSGMSASQAMVDRGETKSRLEQQVALLPTPRATDGTKGGPNQRGSSGDLMLPSAVMLMATPTTNIKPRSQAFRAGRTPNLAEIMLPTPTVGDAKSARNSTATRHRTPPTGVHAGDTLTDALVPTHGASTDQPSPVGRPS